MYHFDSIAGYKAEKEELKKLCSIFNNRESYLKKGARLPKGLILYGGSGNGKTLFAKVLAAECNMPLCVIDLTDVSDTKPICGKIKSAFDKAKSNKSLTMIFMDEIDKILPNDREEYYSDQSKIILTQLLTLIDGIAPAGDIFFVATCNDYYGLPQSLVRPGRIDKKIYIDIPNYHSRVEILKMYIHKSHCSFEKSAEEIAALCAGLSGAALEVLINECILSSNTDNFIPARLIDDALEQLRNEDIPRDVRIEERKMNAAHQVGHYVVGQVLHKCDSVISRDDGRVCNSFYDGFLSADDGYSYDDEYDDDEEEGDDEGGENEADDNVYFVKSDFGDLFAVLCAGRIGEELFYRGATDKCRSDMKCTRYLITNMAECGMLGLDLLYDSNDDLPYPQSVFDRLNEQYYKMLLEAEKTATEILKANKKVCKALVNALIDNKVLNTFQLKQIIDGAGGIKAPRPEK